jgi:flagellar motor protein MotB
MRMPESKQSLVNGHSSLVQRQNACPECEEEEELIRTKPLAEQITPLVQRQVEPEEKEEKEESIQRKALYNKTPQKTEGLQHSIQSLQGGGKFLSLTTRRFFESRFGQDFSQIKVHNNLHGVEIAKSIKARAFTIGNNIFFGSGEYTPETTAGKRLLAHELVHTVQQKKSGQKGKEFNIQRQEEPWGEPISFPEIPNHLVIDILDILNSTLRIFGIPLPSPRTIMNNFRLISNMISPQVDNTNIMIPPTEHPEELHPSIGQENQPFVWTSPSEEPFQLSMSPLMGSLMGSLTLDGFETGEAELTEQHKSLLTEYVGTINSLRQEYRNYLLNRLIITGHTDAVGEEEENQTLGQQRADAVRAELESLGVPADMMVTESKGETQLRVQTEEANPLNRRVQIYFALGWRSPLREEGQMPEELHIETPSLEQPEILRTLEMLINAQQIMERWRTESR